MRRFYLERDLDETGLSGTGRVAEGVEFTDGRVALRWTTDHAPRTTVVFDCLEDVDRIHGHAGATSIVFVDPVEVTRTQLAELRFALGMPPGTDLSDPRTFVDAAIERASAVMATARKLL